MVILGVPGSALFGFLTDCVWFFHRKKGINRKELTKWFCDKWSKRSHSGVIVYPEGTRTRRMPEFTGENTLKKGFFDVAWNGLFPVQVVIASRKENVLDESNFTMEKGVRVRVCAGKVLHPEAFPTKESWRQAIENSWRKTWTAAYAKETKMDHLIKGLTAKKVAYSYFHPEGVQDDKINNDSEVIPVRKDRIKLFNMCKLGLGIGLLATVCVGFGVYVSLDDEIWSEDGAEKKHFLFRPESWFTPKDVVW
eukprot:g2504.t1